MRPFPKKLAESIYFVPARKKDTLSDDEGETAGAQLAAGKGKATQKVEVVGSVLDNSLYHLAGEKKRHERHGQ